MRYLSHKRERFLDLLNNYPTIYSYTNRREQLVLSAGILNFIWNGWNNFWRDYWLAHICGGFDFADLPIVPHHANYNDKQGCHYLISVCKNRRHTIGQAIIGVHQEATWGDPSVITSIASNLLPSYSHMNYLITILGLYQQNIEHLQRIRNSFIHLNNENVFHLKSLTGYYSFSPDQELIDILESTNISSRRKCFDNIILSLGGMISNL